MEHSSVPEEILPSYSKLISGAQPRYRITHPDPLNWCIEEWQAGGVPIERGRYAGQLSQAKWKAAESFYPSLRNAATALLTKAAGDALLTGEATSILEALTLAEARVVAVVEAVEAAGKATA